MKGPYHFCLLLSPSLHENSLDISNLLEETSSLCHSIVFLYFFALFTLEDFLISPCYSLELCIQMSISFLFSFAFHFSFLHSYLSGLLRQQVCFFLGMVLIPVSCTVSHTSIHSSSGTLSIRSNPLNLFLTLNLYASHCIIIRDLI